MAMTLEQKIAKAKSLLILSNPFFGNALLRRRILIDEDGSIIPTAAVDQRTGQIYLNRKFCENLKVSNIQFILAHECLHYMLLHGTRRGWRNALAWNIACDKVINDMLIASNVGEPLDRSHMAWQEGARDKSAEELYVEPEVIRISMGGGNGKGGEDGKDGKDGDNNGDSPWQAGDIGLDIINTGPPLTADERNAIETRVRMELAQCAAAARMRGNLPGSLSRLVEETLMPKTPWHQELQDFMQSMLMGDPSWSRPNKRFVPHNVFLPAACPEPHMGRIVLGIDTSGSISDREMAEAEGHLNRIMEACHPERVDVIYCDTQVGSVDTYDINDLPAKFKNPSGGGGTNLCRMFDWVEENGETPDVMIVITDGYTPYPDSEPGYPVIWVMTTEVNPPWGRIIRHS